MKLRDSEDVPDYAVSQKIRTVASLDSTVKIEDITLRPFPGKPGKSVQSWIADVIVDAPDGDHAIAAAWERFIPLLDRLAVVTQSAFSFAAQSYLVRRLTDNEAGVFFMLCTRARHPNGMPLWNDEQRHDIERLASVPSSALRNFREAANASTVQGALSALVMAAEALAGNVQKARKCQCGGQVACAECGKPAVSPFPDKERLEQILGEASYKALYRGTKKGGAVRNKLMHGTVVPMMQVLGLTQNSYDRVLEYLRQTYGLKTVGSIANAPRSFTQWEYFAHYARLKSGAVPDLPLLDDGWPAQPDVDLINPPDSY